MEGGKPREHEHVPPFECFAEMEEKEKCVVCDLMIKRYKMGRAAF